MSFSDFQNQFRENNIKISTFDEYIEKCYSSNKVRIDEVLSNLNICLNRYIKDLIANKSQLLIKLPLLHVRFTFHPDIVVYVIYVLITKGFTFGVNLPSLYLGYSKWDFTSKKYRPTPDDVQIFLNLENDQFIEPLDHDSMSEDYLFFSSSSTLEEKKNYLLNFIKKIN